MYTVLERIRRFCRGDNAVAHDIVQQIDDHPGLCRLVFNNLMGKTPAQLEVVCQQQLMPKANFTADPESLEDALKVGTAVADFIKVHDVLALSPNLNYYVYDDFGGFSVKELDLKVNPPAFLSLSPLQDSLLIGKGDKGFYICNLEDGFITSQRNFRKNISSAAEHSGKIAIAYVDDTVEVNGVYSKEFPALVTAVCFNKTGSMIAVAYSNVVALFTEDLQKVYESTSSSRINSLCFAGEDSLLALSSNGKVVQYLINDRMKESAIVYGVADIVGKVTQGPPFRDAYPMEVAAKEIADLVSKKPDLARRVYELLKFKP